MKRYIAITILLTSLMPTWAQASISPSTLERGGGSMKDTTSLSNSILVRIARSGAETERLLSLAWNNPAIKQMWRDYSLSEVSVGYNSRSENHVIDVQQGDKDHTLVFDAKTYMKYKNSTLWGEAFYNNGRIKGVTWNETSEPQVVEPYLLADSVGGKMNVERYSFMGGWANYNGRLAWGATIGYTAGLYYRNVDPRPRNVTACLDIQAGIGYNVWHDYVLAASINYRKYKQTNNVAFYSELGNDKIFHLVGFAGDYSRFAGTGIQTYYNGNRVGATINLHPAKGHGFSASVDASRFSFNNIITQLNKLPMAHVALSELQAEAAWLSPVLWNGNAWGVKASMLASRRVGTENIFGDPAASVFTQIGALDMYHCNRFAASLSGTWEKRWGMSWQFVGLSLHPVLEYSHLNEIYADPATLRQINEMRYGLRMRLGAKPFGGNAVQLGLIIEVNHYDPLKSELMLHSDEVKLELAGLERALRSTFSYLSSNRTSLLAGLDVTLAISGKYALRVQAAWQRTSYIMNTQRNELDLSLGLLF